MTGKCQEENELRKEKIRIMKKVALHNLGCKVNAYETEAMQEMLEQNGYEIVPFNEGADIYIINTCTVTNMADRKSRQMLHKAKKLNQNAIVVAAGCYVQAEKNKNQESEIDPCIDIIIGNNKKQDLVRILEEFIQKNENENYEEWIEINQTHEYENLSLSKTSEHTRAYIKVQDGCNQFCTYCIIPFARGRVRSRNKDAVVNEVMQLVDNGYKEVVLTGIHLSSYGVDTGEDLLSLIEAIHQVKGLQRIRLGSLEPRIIDEHFVKRISELETICPHFHLSLQSGSDDVLLRMNRRYSTTEYREKCELLRKYFLNPAITTDIIVGFPGETPKEFQETMEYVREIEFYETHVFKYSPREGTKAATMVNQVPEQVKQKRSNQLIELNQIQQKKYEEALLGKRVEVLIEEKVSMGGKSLWVGHTKEYVKIAVEDDNNLKNQLVNILIENRSQIIH